LFHSVQCGLDALLVANSVRSPGCFEFLSVDCEDVPECRINHVHNVPGGSGEFVECLAEASANLIGDALKCRVGLRLLVIPAPLFGVVATVVVALVLGSVNMGIGRHSGLASRRK